MASSARGLRLIKSINYFTKRQPDYFDTHNIFKKVIITSMSNGVLKGSFTVDVTMCNIAGTIHGGFIASVLDACSTYAQVSIPDSRLAWTTNLHLNFFKISKIGDKVNVETSVLKSGQSPVMEAVMRDESGNLLAKSVGSFITGKDSYQQLFKQTYLFDVYEN